jgi:glycosyltransferase involved in cell wall biosynthesis
VSVIVAVQNGERYLAAALDSIAAQTYPPAEVIVVDGHSVDRTTEIAQSFAQVRLIAQTAHGVADAYNIGIEAARGELVAFLSHDDLWTPNKLSVQVNYLGEHPVIQYTIARMKYFLEPGVALPLGFRSDLLENEHVGYMMETLVARRSLFEHIGLYDTRLPIGEDVDWFARAHDSRIPMAVLPDVLLYKRVHDENISLHPSITWHYMFNLLKQSIDRKRAQRARQAPVTDIG